MKFIVIHVRKIAERRYPRIADLKAGALIAPGFSDVSPHCQLWPEETAAERQLVCLSSYLAPQPRVAIAVGGAQVDKDASR